MTTETRIGGGFNSNQCHADKRASRGIQSRNGRQRSLQLLSVTACAIAGLMSKSAMAASGSWNGLTDNTWAGSNWSATPVPGTGDTATFNGAGNGNTTIDLGGGVTVQNIRFDTSSVAAYNIGAGAVGSQTLTLNDSGSITLTPLVANNETFDANLILGTDPASQTYVFTNSSPDTLSFAGNITGGTGTGTAGVKYVTFNGTGNITDTGILAFGSTAPNLSPQKYGSGTFTLESSAASTYSGYTTVYAGTMVEDFTNFASNNMIAAGSSLRMGGGTFQINGNASGTTSQTFGGTTAPGGGLNVIQLGTNTPTLNLGIFTQTLGSAIELVGPATQGSGGSVVAATGTILTTDIGTGNNNGTAGTGTKGLLWNGTTRAGVATVGLYDWASTNTAAGANGTTPWTVIGGSQVSGFYTPVAANGSNASGDINVDWAGGGNVNCSSGGTEFFDTMRFNANAATTLSTTGASRFYDTGILVTPNVGTYNVTIAGTTGLADNQGNGAGAVDIYQNNTAGELIFTTGFADSKNYATNVVKAGAGTLSLTVLSGNTGQLYLAGGVTMANSDGALGNAGTGAQINLNGGVLLSTVTMGLYNGTVGTNNRVVVVGADGGGLAAAAGTTLTIPGQVQSANPAGPLVIGIPVSATNSSPGVVPGTGGTANPTAVYGTGTVILDYANNTAGNSQFSPMVITGGATLQINSQYDLGGANATSLTFNNGTLQYSASLASGAAGADTDISTNGTAITPVIFTGNATIDTNSHNITYTNPIGYGGPGGLTVVDSTAGVKGSLTLNGSNSYTGPTAINSGKLVLAGGASLATSGVTINTGGTFQVSSTSSVVSSGNVILSGGTVSLVDSTIGTFSTGGLNLSSGTVSFELSNSGTAQSDAINVTAANGLNISGGSFNLYSIGGLTKFSTNAVGTYTLINYTGTDTIAGGSAALNTDLSIGNKVPGLTYSFADTGSAIQLTIGGTPVTSGGWITDGGGSWNSAVNWSSSPLPIPNSAGSTATFGGGAPTALNLNRVVTLDVNETVGTLVFASPNGESYTINQGAGGSLIIDGANSEAALTVSSGSHVINAPVSLNTGVDVTVAGGGTVAINGNISNGIATSTLIKDGTGTLVLAGSNSYGPAAGTVGTTINAGTVQIANSLGFSTGDVALTANATLQAGAPVISVANNFNIVAGVTTVDTQANSLTLSGAVTGGGALTEIGTGTLILSGSNTYPGTTTVSTGTLQLGAGGTSGYVSGAIVDNGAVTLDRTDSYNLGNLISGAGSLTQNGSGNVTLTASNTYTGNTFVAAGTLTLGSSLAIQNSTLNYSAGTVSFGTLATATIGGLTGSGTTLNLNNSTGTAVALTIGGNNTSNTYTGTLIGAGSVTETGTGTTILGSGAVGAANFSGGISVVTGTLQIGGVSNMSSGANFTLANTGPSCNLIIADSAIVTTTGSLTDGLVSANGIGYTTEGAVTVENNAHLTVGSFAFGDGATRLGGLGSQTVTVQNSGVFTVNGTYNLNNTNPGTGQASNTTTNLKGGTLAVQSFIESGANALHVANIQFNGGTLEALAGDGATAFLPTPAIYNEVVTDVDAGGLIFNSNGFTDTIGTNLLHGSGTTPDGGLTKIGQGTLILSNNGNAYNGPTNVSTGLLVISQNGGLPSGNSVTVGSGAGLIDVQNSVLGRVGSLNINGRMIVQSNPSLQNITQEAAGGYNGGAWNGSSSSAGIPITSSVAASDTTHLRALGVIQNDNGTGSGIALYSTFEG
jgi:autotransporter-associated beta strand protein